MPFKLDIFAPDRIVVGVARGDISTADLAAFVQEMIAAGVLHYRKNIDITSATSTIGESRREAGMWKMTVQCPFYGESLE